MEKLYLYLDDVRTPIDPKWIVVRNYDEFVQVIEKEGLENFETISLDHDLGDTAMDEFYWGVYSKGFLNYDNITEKTGMDCAKYLIEKSMNTGITLPTIYTHSFNPIGSANIMGIINRYLLFCNLPQTCVRVNINFK